MTHPLGGELLAYSDLDGTHGAGPARGQALATLARTARGRVLVVGPHDPELIDAILDGTKDLTLLVRARADAKVLTARYPSATVYSGDLAALDATLDADTAYDAIVVLAGLDRLTGPETDRPEWTDVLGRLTRRLRPDGVLLLGIANPLGVHRLTAPPTPPADQDWAGDLGGPGFDAVVAALGRPVVRAYGGFPSPVEPTVLVGSDTPDSGVLQAALVRTGAGTGSLADPGRVAARALRSQAAMPVAAAWFIVAGSTPDADLPPSVPDSDRPDVRTLEEAISLAAVKRDLPAVRELLTAWQRGPSGVPADQVIVEPAGLTALGAGVEPVEALRRLAAFLTNHGYAHAWPAEGVADLTVALAAMAGIELDPAEVPTGEPAATWHDLVAERDELARLLADAQAQRAAYQQLADEREQKLRETLHLVELLSTSGPARMGRAFVGGVRVARRTARRFRLR
ncbi:SAM-dependent methyltransferase [Hamadaea flava]|uniref:Class I SAM-dependent methyltransferase n=1 Tax=Hamadaea flava TaxID=1742688 RepID=A0ABV8LV98_9ACTN|nr:hypothetical protein [Hamadaea flava]MCP2328805.1 SAM-dependent methyltransferase [Hamadaea flava]